MASNSNLLVLVLLVLFSVSLTSVISKQEDESFVMAANDQGSSMINVDDLAKARSLQALVSGSKVVVNKAVARRTLRRGGRVSTVGAMPVSGFTATIIASVVATIIVLWILYCLYQRRKEKKALSFERVNEQSETTPSKAEDHV